MFITQAILVFLAIFISDIFWVKCVKSVNEETPFQAGAWAVGIFLPTALGTVAYIANPLLILPACLGHFSGTALMVWWGKKTKARDSLETMLDKYQEFLAENEGREFR